MGRGGTGGGGERGVEERGWWGGTNQGRPHGVSGHNNLEENQYRNLL